MRLVCRIYMDLFSRSNRIFVKHQSQMTLESWDTMGLEKHWQRWFSMLYLYKSQRRRTAHSPCSKDRVATWEWQMHFDCVTLSHSRCSCCKPTAWCSSRLEGRWHAFCKIQKGIRGICWYFMIFHNTLYLLFVLRPSEKSHGRMKRYTGRKDIHTCRNFLFEQHWFSAESSERSLLKYPELANDLRLCPVYNGQVPWSR